MNQTIQYDLEAVMTEAVATGLFGSLCTLQQPSGNLGPSGAPDGTYADVVGLVDIACTAPPPSEARIQATEVKAMAEIMAVELKHVLLSGYYPACEGGAAVGWRAVVDGVDYDLLGAESDSQGMMTRLAIKLAEI